jgi:glycosyltransferase involved in cell wall biosynthesis
VRILQLVSSFAYSGPAAATLSLAVEQRGLGHDVTLGHDTVRPQGNAFEEGMGPRVAASGIAVASELALCTKTGPWTWMRDRAALRQRLPNTDVIHVHFSHDHALAALARGSATRPVLVRTIHSTRSLKARLGQAWLMKKTDGFIVHAHATAEAGARAFGLPRTRFHVVRGPVDTARFWVEHRGKARTAFREAHRIPQDAPMVLMTAIFQAGRGQDHVLEAWPAVLQRLPNAVLCFAGLGERRDVIMEQARGVPNVKFVGYLKEDLPLAYAAADVSVLWTMGNDGYGRAMLESMACGTPALVPDLPELAEVVDTHHLGATFPPGNVHALGQRLTALLETPWDAEHATRARRAMEAHHAGGVIAGLTLDLYTQLLDANTRAV